MAAPRRGEVWWATLGRPRGSEPGFPRPVLVVQSDRFNESAIQTVLVATIGSNLRLAEAPGNVRVRKAETGLPKDSVVNVSQVLTLDRRFLRDQSGTLPARRMNTVAMGLRLVFGL